MPQSAPEVPPARSDQASAGDPQGRPDTGALQPLHGFRGGGRAPLHPDAVIAVAGDRIDPAQLVGVLGEHPGHDLQSLDHLRGDRLRLGGTRS